MRAPQKTSQNSSVALVGCGIGHKSDPLHAWRYDLNLLCFLQTSLDVKNELNKTVISNLDIPEFQVIFISFPGNNRFTYSRDCCKLQFQLSL